MHKRRSRNLLWQLSRKRIDYKGRVLEELDLDGLLALFGEIALSRLGRGGKLRSQLQAVDDVFEARGLEAGRHRSRHIGRIAPVRSRDGWARTPP